MVERIEVREAANGVEFLPSEKSAEESGRRQGQQQKWQVEWK